jgi:prephenate dehydrogenase
MNIDVDEMVKAIRLNKPSLLLFGGSLFLRNQEAILHWTDKFSKELDRYRRLLASGDKQLEEALAEANKARQEWLKDYLVCHPEPKP